ncbi:MAG: YcgN family cysteine cluster protein [Haliea sp.]
MERFWENKSLAEMSREEWESLCDGCARCCLIKLEDEESGELCTTNVACRYLEIAQCHCSVYSERTLLVPECLQVTRENVAELYWMPQSCAYRLLAEGKPLPDWHPLVTGRRGSVHEAGIAVSGYAISELSLDENSDLEDYIID